jgi:hypothetical protein
MKGLKNNEPTGGAGDDVSQIIRHLPLIIHTVVTLAFGLLIYAALPRMPVRRGWRWRLTTAAVVSGSG